MHTNFDFINQQSIRVVQYVLIYFSAISTTFEAEESSKVTNILPHSSPLDILQTSTMMPNETAEPFCLVMGKARVCLIVEIKVLIVMKYEMFQELDINLGAFCRETPDPVWNVSVAETHRLRAAQKIA